MTLADEGVREAEAAVEQAVAAALGQGPPRQGHCALCGDSAERRAVFSRLGTHWWRCQGCGQYFVSPLPSEDILDELATRGHLARYYALTGQRDPQASVEEEYRNGFAKLARDVFPYRRFAGRLLDFGAGSGGMVRAANEQGMVADGIEPDRALCALAGSANGVQLHCGRPEELNAPRAHYAVVTMHHFLERTTEPAAVLAAAHRLLLPGGIVVVDTPAGESVNFAAAGARWPGLHPLEQRHLFVAESLARLLADAGFFLLDLYSPDEEGLVAIAEVA